MSTDDTRLPPATVWGTLRARDAHALIRFLVDTFGFVPTAVHDADDGGVSHAQLDWPEGGGVMLGSHRADGPWTLEPGTAGLYVVTDRVAELHQRAVDAGTEVIRELEATDYDSGTFAIRDPEGNLWSFGSYRGEPRTG